MRIVASVGCLALAAAGCFRVDPINDLTRPIREERRAHEAAKWAGTYAFKECAPPGAPSPGCSSYTIVVTREGASTVRVAGDQARLHVVAKPRVMRDGLQLEFESYAEDGHVPWRDLGLGVVATASGDLAPGQRLGLLSRGASGTCLRFEDLQSPLGTKELCSP